LVCAAFDEVADPAGPSDEMLAALEDVNEKLSRWQPPAAAAPASGTVTPGAAGPIATPREDEKPVGAPTSGSKVIQTPAARVLAADYDLQREGKPISLRAACERAGNVDRGHLRAKYPEAVDAICRMKTPDRTPWRGVRDSRTGDIDALDDSED
jgi:hypothetical protein